MYLFLHIKLQSPSKYSPFDAIHLLRCFFHCSKQFLNSSILMPFSVSAIFCFTSSTSAKHCPLRTFFHSGKQQKKVPLGKNRWIGRVGYGGHAVFGQKLVNIQCSLGRCSCKSHIMKWKVLKKFSKNFTEAKRSLSQQHQLVHWYRWAPENTPSRERLYYEGPTLQKIIAGFGGSPTICSFLR